MVTDKEFIQGGEEFTKQMEAGKHNAQSVIKDSAMFLRDFYYNKNNTANLISALKIIELVESLKTYDNKRGTDDGI